MVPVNSGPNLLKNPSFETGLGGLADDWLREYDETAVLSLVDIGVVEGNLAQHFSKIGTDNEIDGRLEIFQAVYNNTSYGPGDVLVFSLYASGSISRCSVIIGVGSFSDADQYVDEKDVYLTGLNETPQIFGLSYQVPLNGHIVAAFIQFDEIYSYSSLSISIDNASLVRMPTP